MKRGHRPAGYRSNAGAVADIGKYFADEEVWMHMEQDALTTAVAEARAAGRKVVIVGGPGGRFADWIHRHKEIDHVESTEARPSDSTFTLSARTGVVVLTRYVSMTLHHAVMADCERRALPLFGVYNTYNAVNKALDAAFFPPLAAVAAPKALPPAPPDEPADVREAREWFQQARTHLAGLQEHMALLEDVAVEAVRRALTAEAALKAQGEAMEQLKALKAIFQSIK
jgi:hypothetical protein